MIEDQIALIHEELTKGKEKEVKSKIELSHLLPTYIKENSIARDLKISKVEDKLADLYQQVLKISS